jgi:lipid-binding SYLF domain-containing protein
VIAPRGDTNNSFYGKKVTPSEILGGKVPPPAAAAPLMKELNYAGKGATKNP